MPYKLKHARNQVMVTFNSVVTLSLVIASYYDTYQPFSEVDHVICSVQA